MNPDPKELQRFTPGERVNHWLVAICFILVSLSGLSLFHPALWPLNQLFGGGVWTRILHPFMGLLLTISFASMFGRFRKLNRITESDMEWLKRIGELLRREHGNLPAQDKFDAGEKALFWALSISLSLMFVSGVVIWRSFFNLPVALVRFASVIHAAVGAVMIGLIFGHIYAALWTRGTIHAMVYGTVSPGWARHHHKLWYQRMTGG